ncbi:MAG: hypothetical protein OXI24_04415 [Candidatus Poribacteria bacterium]|nr:hypothetical protein [Candidatus Poribacteria bacterium]MDE0553434.1 hypothetical protein [Candidatus Poribacteria bacterium]MYK17446.1 hypothetical protein [Candidatus Poribacteria bacterium]
MRKYREWREVLIEQLVDRGNVIGYLEAVMEEYQTHGNIAAVQMALESAVEAQSEISKLAKHTHTELQVLLKELSSEKAPRIDTLRTILTALGCRLSVEPLEEVGSAFEIKGENHSVKPPVDANPKLEITDNP